MIAISRTNVTIVKSVTLRARRLNLLLWFIPIAMAVHAPSLLAQTVPQISNTKVNGTIVENGATITVHLNIAANETFAVGADVKNAGVVSPAGYNNISMSVAQFTSSDYLGNIRYDQKDPDLNYNEYFGAGGPDGNYEYVFVESNDTNGWLNDESNFLQVAIQPRTYGTYVVYVRAAMSNQPSWTSGWTYTPTSGDLDCTGKNARRINVNVAPPCTYTVSPTTVPTVAAGGTYNIGVTAATGCTWTASEGLSWLTITSGASGSGNGTVVLSVNSNPTGGARSGSITVADQTVQVNQSYCTISFTNQSAA